MDSTVHVPPCESNRDNKSFGIQDTTNSVRKTWEQLKVTSKDEFPEYPVPLDVGGAFDLLPLE